MNSEHIAVGAAKRRVLLVDDEYDVTEALTINLEATGDYTVKAVNDPRQTIAVAREFRPDIIILDVVMPGMDGGDVQRAIRSDRHLKDTPIVMVTALVSRDEVGDGALEAGGDYMLAKPVKLATLVELIEQRIGKGPGG